MFINEDSTSKYVAAVNAVTKIVSHFIEGGELKDRFEAFDKPEVAFGDRYEMSVYLRADKASSAQPSEHAKYAPKGIDLIFSEVVGGCYPATISPEEIRECVGNAAKQEEVAARIIQTLYDGWTDDKNTAIAAAVQSIITDGTHTVTVTRTAGQEEKYAIDLLTAAGTWAENIREGITGTMYGNSVVGDKPMPASGIAVVMSNATAKFLDGNGYAKVFNEGRLSMGDVIRVTSYRIPEGTILVTDVRNIQARPKYEELVSEIKNSDGSYNYFYNKYEFIETAMTTEKLIAFPYIVIKTEEASAAALNTPAPEQTPEQTEEEGA